ncbi:2Fe-2S iron-sulfur cluster-binding protein [Clostridium sp.]|uniref:2Fe-2S iron-sulfur cluster-binding protein n=1 Tax=Clostridium sp. TaxID=1506 RepID=UPI001A4D10F6|nr:2Fe-2S iron-sulfur cluster-binding protein [Clostridium sp.]MBK5243272.1 hypothetical protein [Clostridium sp.]
MKIKIDEKEIIVKDTTKNIVEIAEDNGITITAPCFRNKKKNGCCNVCVIEIDGVQKYACGTKPQDGMNIVYNRDDLILLRKERLEKFSQAIKSGDTSNNKCGGIDPNKQSSSCSCSGSCCSD